MTPSAIAHPANQVTYACYLQELKAGEISGLLAQDRFLLGVEVKDGNSGSAAFHDPNGILRGLSVERAVHPGEKADAIVLLGADSPEGLLLTIDKVDAAGMGSATIFRRQDGASASPPKEWFGACMTKDSNDAELNLNSIKSLPASVKGKSAK